MAQLAKDGSQSNDFRILSIQFQTLDDVDRYVRAHFRYRTEPFEIVAHPILLLDTINELGYFYGDCDDCATFEGTIFKALGFPVRFVAIRTQNDDPNFLHVFVEVQQNGEWLRYDCTVAPGTQLISYEDMIVYV